MPENVPKFGRRKRIGRKKRRGKLILRTVVALGQLESGICATLPLNLVQQKRRPCEGYKLIVVE